MGVCGLGLQKGAARLLGTDLSAKGLVKGSGNTKGLVKGFL